MAIQEKRHSQNGNFFEPPLPPPLTHVTLCNFFDQPPSLPCHILKK